MNGSLKDFRARALARPEVKKAYEELKEESALLDEGLRARIDALWLKEAESRMAAYRSGELDAVDADQVFAELGRQS